MINEQIERIEVLKMCRELAIRSGRYNAVEDEGERTKGGYGSLDYEEKSDAAMSMPLMTEDGERDVTFSETLSGAISTTKQIMFERMLFRVSRGNAIVNFREVLLHHNRFSVTPEFHFCNTPVTPL